MVDFVIASTLWNVQTWAAVNLIILDVLAALAVLDRIKR